jgi:PTH1 family peptidyl-tRNA hydrolase
MVVEGIALDSETRLKRRLRYKAGKGSVEDSQVVLAEPLTFMNRSGIAVKEIVRRYCLSPENLIVIHDDIDMDTGRLKIRAGGSSGGHKGVQSIIQELGTGDFVRVKIGIGREEGLPVEEYVLENFGKDEIPAAREAIAVAMEAVASILSQGVQSAMNRFNRRPQPPA